MPRLAAVLGALGIASAGILYRWSGVDPSTGVVFRSLYGLPLLVIAAAVEVRALGPMPRRTVGLSAFAGVLFAVDLLSFHYAVDNLGAGLGTMMGNLQVVIVAFVAWILWHERPSREVLVSLPILAAGVVLVAGAAGAGVSSANAQAGVEVGFITAVTYAGYLLVIRRASADQRPAGPVAVATAVTALCAALFGVLVGDLHLAPTWPAHGYLLVLGVLPQSIGVLLIQAALPRLPAVITSVLLLAQPVITLLLGVILLGEDPSHGQLAGVALILSGIAVATGWLGRLSRSLSPARPIT